MLHFLETVLETALAGVTGTALMSVILTIIHRAEWANADMIRAVGSLVTRRYENSLVPGLGLHFAAGTVFAFPYVILMRGTGISPLGAMVGLGFLLGLFHGVVMSYAMLALVAENHPIERFREPGFEVAAAHVVGHLVYGIGVGAMVALLDIDFGIRF
jgi:hypothetical protein